MKKLILSSIVAAFACVVSAQAGEDCCAKTCADKAKVKGTDCTESGGCCADKAKAAALAKAKSDAAVKGATKLLAKR